MAEFTFAPLTPASFLDRAAAVFAGRTAVVDGERRFTAIRAETISALPGRGRPPRPGPHLALDRAGGRRQPPGRGHPRAGRRAQGPAVS